MIYADFEYYQNSFGGTLITSETEYRRSAGKAADYLNSVTFGRIETEIPDDFAESVRRCSCELTEYLATYEESTLLSGKNQKGAKTYEQIGSYSANYGSVSDSIKSLLDGSSGGLETLLANIAGKYLGRTGLLYRGLD